MAPAVDSAGAIIEVLHGTQAAKVESQTLDFKEEAADGGKAIKDLVAAAICFANADGGTIVFGVSDKLGGKSAFLGATLSAELIRSRIFDLTRPQLLVDVVEDQIELDGRRVRILQIHVPESPDVHCDMQGRATLRVGTDCRSMDTAQQQAARERKGAVDWSAQVTDCKIKDLSKIALELARDRLRTAPGSRKDLAGASDRDLLRALGVMRSDGKLLRAAEVLFRSAPNDVPPSALYQFRDTPGAEPTAVERLEGPLVVAFSRLMEIVLARRKLTPLQLPTGQQVQVEDFPELAVREALANGLIHRDYVARGPVVVEHSPEVFVVTSPGPLVAGVTPENILTHPSKPRNARLANAARVMGLIEEIGRGVDRMYREMIRSGRTVPSIESSAQQVRVTLVGGAPDTQLARFVAGLPAVERGDVDTMLIVLTLCSKRTLAASQLAPVLQKTEEEAQAVLRRLAGESVGILEPTRESARLTRPSYRFTSEALRALGSTVGYQRRTTDEIDRKVIDHLREYGKVTNRTVRNLLDVKTDRANAVLSDLMKRGVITKTSKAQRGPSVEYGPGSNFPARDLSTR